MRIEIWSNRVIPGWRGEGLAPGRRLWKAWRVAALAAACWVPLCFPCLAAKEKAVTKTVSGAVLDEADNAIVGAAVKLTDLYTGKQVAAYTGEGGHYQFADLPPNHDYEVQATYKGSSSDVRKVSSVDTRRRIVINLTIPGAKP
jgi:hypothetical protein